MDSPSTTEFDIPPERICVYIGKYRDLVDDLGLEGETNMTLVLVGDFYLSGDNRDTLKEYLSANISTWN